MRGAFLIAGADIFAADASDGVSDQVAGMDSAIALDGSFKFDRILGSLGISDLDGGPFDDVLLIWRRNAYLVGGEDLPRLNADEGLVVVFAGLSGPNSWLLRIDDRDSYFDNSPTLGDLNGDGLPELVMETHAPGDESAPHVTYIFSLAELAELDSQDGTADRRIYLDRVAERWVSD